MSLRPKAVSREISANQLKSAELAHTAAHSKHFHRKGEPDGLSIERARRQFLEAYAMERPGLLGGLLDVLPLYSESIRVNQPVQVQFTVAELAAGKQVSIPLKLCPWSSIRELYPALGEALSAWARTFDLTFGGEPAAWAMDTALETLGAWRSSSHQRWICVQWSLPITEMHEAYPAGDPTFYSASTGESAGELSCGLSITWNRPGDETEQEFRKRARLAVDEYIRQMKEWTGRPEKKESWHFYALCLWQAGSSLRSIQSRLASAGPKLLVGSEGDVSAISYAIHSAADFIKIDPRPA